MRNTMTRGTATRGTAAQAPRRTAEQSRAELERLIAENRKMVPEAGRAKYDRLADKTRMQVASRRGSPDREYNKIAEFERQKNRRAVRTGGQW